MLDRVGEIAELFTWLGLLTGVLVLVLGLVVRLFEGTWLTAQADADEIDGDVQLAWLADDGEVYRRFLDPDERATVGTADRVTVHYRRGRPLDAHLDKRTHASRVLVLLGTILTAVGVLALVVQLLVVVGQG
jgi:alkylhydroperoxidase family enzyme